MVTPDPRLAAVAVGMCVALARPASAGAVEYRLKVASVFDPSLTSFLSPRRAQRRRHRAGLPEAQRRSWTKAAVIAGMIVTQRPLAAVPDSIARAWGGVSVTAPIARGRRRLATGTRCAGTASPASAASGS